MSHITEQRPVAGPLVYGYLCLPRGSQARRTALTTTLVTYCRQHELLLGAVFTETSTSAVVVNAAAFIALHDAVSMPGCYGVVLPTGAHLGASAQITQQRTRMLTQAGARLMVVRTTGAAGRNARTTVRRALEPPH